MISDTLHAQLTAAPSEHLGADREFRLKNNSKRPKKGEVEVAERKANNTQRAPCNHTCMPVGLCVRTHSKKLPTELKEKLLGSIHVTHKHIRYDSRRKRAKETNHRTQYTH